MRRRMRRRCRGWEERKRNAAMQSFGRGCQKRRSIMVIAHTERSSPPPLQSSAREETRGCERNIPGRARPPRGSVKVRPWRPRVDIISPGDSDLVRTRRSPGCLHRFSSACLSLVSTDAAAAAQPAPRASITGRTGARPSVS